MLPVFVILIFIFTSMIRDLVVNSGANLVVHLAALVSVCVIAFGCGVTYKRQSVYPAGHGPLDNPD